MRSGGAPPNSVTYNTLIDACVAYPELSLTLTLTLSLSLTLTLTLSLTLSLTLTRCVRRGEIARARQIVRWLVEGQV